MIVEPGRGVSCAKNPGWRSSRSTIIVCTDDDCYPEENYLDSIFECFSNDPRLGFVGGRILLHDPTDRRITIQESLEPLSFPPGSFIPPGCIHGANVAYRRAALSEVGGFDPWFGAGAIYCAEEVELMARISAAGWNGAYDPRSVVYYHRGRKTRGMSGVLDDGMTGVVEPTMESACLIDECGASMLRIGFPRDRTRHWDRWPWKIVSGLHYVARASLAGRSLNG
jgi:glycosyl transferase family 21